jgi:glycosyltransferase involved in cell wall biosynthesis
MPTVSVILPTFNRLTYLREAVGSVLAQTFADWELIVADDGSTDGTRDYLKQIAEGRVRAVLLDHTGNRSLVRNAAIAQAGGEWIAFLDSDDVWLPDKLKLQLEQLAANPSRRWSSTGIAFIDANGAPLRQRTDLPRAQSGWILEPLLTFDAGATTPSLVVHKSLLDEIGGFDESLLWREDYDLDLRLAARSEIQALPVALTLVREHPGRTSSNRRVAELHAGTAVVFRKAANAATNKSIRDICRRQRAMQLVFRARALSGDGEHIAALSSVTDAFRDAPLAPAVWRAAVGCVLRSLGVRRSPG